MMFGFKFLIITKALDYKASYPNASLIRRLFWVWWRVFLWGILYRTFTLYPSINFILRSFFAFLCITVTTHLIPKEFMDKYYSDTSLTKKLIKLQYNVGLARAFVLGSGRIYASYTESNFALYAFLFIIAEGIPTDFPVMIETWIYKGWKELNWAGLIMNTNKYLGSVLLAHLYFK